MGGADELRAIIERQKTPKQKRADTAFGADAVRRSRGGGGGSSRNDKARLAAEKASREKATRESLEKARLEAEQKRQSQQKAQQKAQARASLERQVRTQRTMKAQKQQRIQKLQSQLAREREISQERAKSIAKRKIKKEDISMQRIIQESRKQVKTISVEPEEKQPINIFKISTWNQLGNALKESKKKKDRSLGKKILTEPLLLSTKFVPRVQEGVVGSTLGLLQLVKNPSLIRQVPGNIKADLSDTATLLKTSPSEGIGKIGADIFTFKIIGGSLKVTGKATSAGNARFNPVLKRFKDNTLTLKLPKETFIRRGRNVFLKKNIVSGRELAKSVKEVALPTKREVILKKGLLTDNAATLAEQARLAGTKGTIVTAQADRLVGFFRRNKIVRKPIPNEANFASSTKNLLKRFDEGTISRKDFFKLNKLVLRDSGKTLLERSLFADPKGLVRFTRLGGEVAEASIKDIIRGNFSFRKTKPQIIVFPEGKIAKFPKSLKDVVNKLKSGEKLTADERARLVKFQTKKTGKWKPVGDVEFKGGVELEVTLAPGESIRRVKKVGTTVIDGKTVQIVEAKIVKLKPKTQKLLDNAKSGKKLTTKEITQLKKSISRETKLKITKNEIRNINKIRRRVSTQKPKLPIRRITSAKSLQRLGIRRKPTKRKGVRRRPSVRKGIPRRPSPRATSGRPGRPRRPSPRATSGRPGRPRRPSPRATSGRPGRPTTPKIPPKAGIPISKKKKRKSKKQGFNVFARPTKKRKGQKRPKLVKVNKSPLTKAKAKDLRNFIADTSLARTASIKPTKLKPRKPRLKVPASFASRTRKKFRPHRFIKGKKVPLRKGTVIEKRNRLLDTKSERLGIGLRKRISQLQPKRKPIIKKPKRKITKTQRDIMLENLEKARAVRLKNLKRRKKK